MVILSPKLRVIVPLPLPVAPRPTFSAACLAMSSTSTFQPPSRHASRPLTVAEPPVGDAALDGLPDGAPLPAALGGLVPSEVQAARDSAVTATPMSRTDLTLMGAASQLRRRS